MMGLEDISNIPISRRGFLSLGAGALAVCAFDLPLLAQDKKQAEPDLPILKKSRISYDKIKEAITKDQTGDQAGKYEQLKQQYLEQVLVEEFKIVQHKQKNKEGFVASWFYWSDAQQKKKAEERIKADLTADSQVDRFKNCINMFDSVLPKLKFFVWYREGIGKELKTSSILADKSLFDLANEQDVFSALDYIHAVAHAREYNIMVEGKQFDMTNTVLYLYFNQNNLITNFHARNQQWANIISGKRTVSDTFKTEAEEKYKSARSDYEQTLRDLEDSDDDRSKLALEAMSTYLKQADAHMKKAEEIAKNGQSKR